MKRERKGGVTQPLFYCVFNGFESVTGYMVHQESDMQVVLPHTYAVLAYDKSVGKSAFPFGLILKSTYEPSDHELNEAIHAYIKGNDHMRNLVGSNMGALSSRLRFDGDAPLTENEMTMCLHRMMIQHVESTAV